jgi:hypothetical protein
MSAHIATVDLLPTKTLTVSLRSRNEVPDMLPVTRTKPTKHNTAHNILRPKFYLLVREAQTVTRTKPTKHNTAQNILRLTSYLLVREAQTVIFSIKIYFSHFSHSSLLKK